MKRQLLFILVALMPMLASAHDAKIGDIYYNLAFETKTAEVTSNDADWFTQSYSGSVSIPASVTHGGVAYSVTSIGSSAFSACSGLTSVTIPSSVTSIGTAAFRSCNGLTSLTIPTSVTSIGEYAFQGCSGLTSLTIPSSVNSIGQSAFEYCSGLTSLIIGRGVKSIGDYAFASCRKLETVACLAESVPSTMSSAFQDSYPDYVTLRVPTKSVAAYSAKAPWNTFMKIEDIGSDGLGKCAKPTITADGKITATSETEGATCHISYEWHSVKDNGTDSVSPNIWLNVTAYATAWGYQQSDTAKATFDLMTLLPNLGDMNGDGKLTTEDVTKLVDKVLRK